MYPFLPVLLIGACISPGPGTTTSITSTAPPTSTTSTPTVQTSTVPPTGDPSCASPASPPLVPACTGVAQLFVRAPDGDLDELAVEITREENELGLLTYELVVDPSGVVQSEQSRTWTADGRPLLHEWNDEGALPGYSTTWTYDTEDREVARIDAYQGTLLGSVTSIWSGSLEVAEEQDTDGDGVTDRWISWTHGSDDRPTTRTEDDGQVQVWTYVWDTALPGMDRDEIADDADGDGFADGNYRYEFNGACQPTLELYSDPWMASYGYPTEWAITARYDGLHRQIGETRSSGSGIGWYAREYVWAWGTNGKPLSRTTYEHWDTSGYDPWEILEWTWTCL